MGESISVDTSGLTTCVTDLIATVIVMGHGFAPQQDLDTFVDYFNKNALFKLLLFEQSSTSS